MASGRIRLLGKVVAEAGEGGATVEKWRSRKTPLILAYLLHRPGRAATRDELGEMLWPEVESGTQKTRLRWEINQFRAALGEAALLTPDNVAVRLGDGVTSDVIEFDRLALAAVQAGSAETRIGLVRQALDLYRDDYLPGYDLPENTLPESDWVSRERERLRDVAYDLQERLARDLDSLGLREDATAIRRDAAARFPGRDALRAGDLPLPPPPPPDDSNTFFGREHEAGRIAGWREGTGRLLTLTGTGGMGKTRLSLEATRGARLAFVALAEALAEGDFFAQIHAALELPDDSVGDRDAVEAQVGAALRARGVCLLVLDNLEQIAETAAPLVARLLDACPELRVLTTSRVPLGIPGEEELPLEPLGASDAFRLFLDRARAVRPDFAGSAEQQKAAAEVVALLDGVPLAIEIAAGHAAVLGPGQMLRQLQQRLDFLKQAPGRGEEPRHRSIRAALEWSLGLLHAKTREVFYRVSVFRGGFSLEAARAVCPAGADVLRQLEWLQRHSLLKVTFDTDGDARYAYLPLTGEFAEERRARELGGEEEEALRDRHASFFRGEAVRVGERLSQGRWSEVRRLLLRDRENFRAATRRFLFRGDGDALYDLTRSLAAPLCELGWWGDAQELLSAADRGPEGGATAPGVRRRLLAVRGAFYLRRGEADAARADWQAALALARDGDPLALVSTLFDLAGLALDSGDADSAARWMDEGEALADLHREAVDGMPGKKVAAAVLRARLALPDPTRAAAHADEAVSGLLALDNDARSATLALAAYVAIHVPPAYRAANRPDDALAILTRGLRPALAEEQTFLVARLLDEFAPTLFMRGRDRDGIAAAYVAAAIHAELRTRHRRRAVAAREDALLHIYARPDDRETLLALTRLLDDRPWRDSLEALASRLLDT